MPEVTDDVADDDVGQVRHELHLQRRVAVGADDHPAGARPLDQRPGRGVAVDEQLHPRRMRGRPADHAADDARRRDDRHVGLDAVALPRFDRHASGYPDSGLPAMTSAATVGSVVAASSDPAAPAAAPCARASARCSCSRTSRSATWLLAAPRSPPARPAARRSSPSRSARRPRRPPSAAAARARTART